MLTLESEMQSIYYAMDYHFYYYLFIDCECDPSIFVCHLIKARHARLYYYL